MIGVGRDGPVGPVTDGASHAAASGGGDPPAARRRTSGRAATEPDSTWSAPAPPALMSPGPSTRRRRTGVDESRAAWAVLASVDGLGPVGLVDLVGAHGSAAAVLSAASGPGAEAVIGRTLGSRAGPHLASRVVEAVRDRRAILESIRDAGLGILTLDDAVYPDRLRTIELPPPVLFVRGAADALSAERCVAVVGTRRPSDAGRSVTARISGTMARTGAVIASGLATGIDGVAHAATVGVGGRTVAVIGGGHAEAIARRHRALAEQIVATGGAVVSEHAPATAPTRGTFPRRNRVISGLAEATVVVEAGMRSGALITAGWALEQGRECFVVPGSIDAPMSAGCLGLLRAYPGQVRVVAGTAALLEDLGLAGGTGRATAGPAAHAATGRPGPEALAAGPGAVLAALPVPVAEVARSLSSGARALDHVVAATGLSVPGALAALTMLEDLGLVWAAYGRYRLAGGLSDLG
jgi:DNA processing protein